MTNLNSDKSISQFVIGCGSHSYISGNIKLKFRPLDELHNKYKAQIANEYDGLASDTYIYTRTCVCMSMRVIHRCTQANTLLKKFLLPITLTVLIVYFVKSLHSKLNSLSLSLSLSESVQCGHVLDLVSTNIINTN